MKQKRTLAFLLALVMVLSFCAFGAGKAAADDDVITFENVIVADDENVTIELINFYEKNVNWWEGAQNEKYVTFRFKNKTNHVIKLNPGNFYLNDEKAYVTMEGGTVSLEAGRRMGRTAGWMYPSRSSRPCVRKLLPWPGRTWRNMGRL